jgi:hypothetical protein
VANTRHDRAGGKPAIVFVSEESCPFCAAERWSLTVALSHFGTWSHLGTTTSSILNPAQKWRVPAALRLGR